MKKKQENMTLDEAKKDIFRRIQRGESYREIVKTKYTIDGITKGFSISEISKIKKQSTGQAINSKDNDPNASLLFKLFKEGESLCDIVEKTQLSPDYVNEMYDKYCKMKNITVLPPKLVSVLFEYAEWMKGSKVTSLNELQGYLEIAVCHFLESEFEDLCEACENPDDWKDRWLNS